MSDILKYIEETTKKPYLNNTTLSVGIPVNLANFANLNTDDKIVFSPDFTDEGNPCIKLTNKKHKDETHTYQKNEMVNRLSDWAFETRLLMRKIDKNKLRKFLSYIKSAIRFDEDFELGNEETYNDRYAGNTHEEILERILKDVE